MDEEKLLSDVDLIVQIFNKAELEIFSAMDGRNLWRDQERQGMMQQIKKILKDLEAESIDKSVPLIEEYYNQPITEAEVSGLFDTKSSFALVDPVAVGFVAASLPEISNSFEKQIRNILNSVYNNIEVNLNRVKKEMRAEIVTEIASAKATGKSRKKLERELINRLQEKGLTGFKIPSDKTKSGEINLSLKGYVHGLTQSSLMNAGAASTIKLAMELEHDLLRISTHKNPSPMCANWAGKVVSISGDTTGYPTLSEALFNGNYKRGGILHKYCRHSLTLFTPKN